MKRQPKDASIFADIDWEKLPAPLQTLDLINLEKDDDYADKDTKDKVIVSESLDPEDIVRILSSLKNDSLVQKRKNHFIHDLSMVVQTKQSPDVYFSSGGSCWLNNIESRIEIKFEKPEDKEELMNKLTKFAEEICSGSVQSSLRAIAEELFMNAMYDAPGESVKSGTQAKKTVAMVPNVLRVYKSPDRILISCEDSYGSINTEKTIQRMDHVYTIGAGQAINMRTGKGAGIGCVIMFEHAETLIFGVQPKKKTLVSCVIPLGLSLKQREQAKKSLHIIRGK